MESSTSNHQFCLFSCLCSPKFCHYHWLSINNFNFIRWLLCHWVIHYFYPNNWNLLRIEWRIEIKSCDDLCHLDRTFNIDAENILLYWGFSNTNPNSGLHFNSIWLSNLTYLPSSDAKWVRSFIIIHNWSIIYISIQNSRILSIFIFINIIIIYIII